jgi:O-antigen/teichoic acid export membrane protein
MEEYEKYTKIRRAIFIVLLMSLAVIIPLVFYFFTVNETLSFKNLDEESYSSRMNDSILYAIILLGCLLLLIGPFVFVINNMFKRYLDFITTLTANDTKKIIISERKRKFYL